MIVVYKNELPGQLDRAAGREGYPLWRHVFKSDLSP